MGVRASMELGALVCTARAPALRRAARCADVCAWYAAGRPADEHAGRRTVQTFTGTDRQVRGPVMALLREALGPVPAAAVDGRVAGRRPAGPAASTPWSPTAWSPATRPRATTTHRPTGCRPDARAPTAPS